jgi:hypothetical protein
MSCFGFRCIAEIKSLWRGGISHLIGGLTTVLYCSGQVLFRQWTNGFNAVFDHGGRISAFVLNPPSQKQDNQNEDDEAAALA